MFKPFIATAVHNGKNYHHFNIRKETASLFGDNPESIVEVEISIHDDQTSVEFNSEKDSSNPDYWGYWDNEKKEMWHIYAAYFLLDMCFPAGLKVMEERGYGKAFRLNVKPIK